MGVKLTVEIGTEFNSLTVISATFIHKGHTSCVCLCKCGRNKLARLSALVVGDVLHCDHCRKKRVSKQFRKHGRSHTKTYATWKNMVDRCINEECRSYKDYGERGIRICTRWLEFENFLEDMGEKPDGLSLDRINNDGHYEPSNCRWATRIEQANNTRKTNRRKSNDRK